MSGVVLISPAGTGGWRTNEDALTEELDDRRILNEVKRVQLGRFEKLRHPWATGSLIVAAEARRVLRKALDESDPQAIIAVNSTASLLFPFRRLRRLGVPVAVRIDCPASEQFPGPTHVLHRWLERRALRRADLALTMGPQSSAVVEPLARKIIELPVAPTNFAPMRADAADPPFVMAYAGQPEFKGLDLIVDAWERLGSRRRNATLEVAGVDERVGRKYLKRKGIAEPDGLRWIGSLDRNLYFDRLYEAAAFVSASRIEGHGFAQLEALEQGIPLVTTSSRGAYEAYPLALKVAPELVCKPDASQLADALSKALTMTSGEQATYAVRAMEAQHSIRAANEDRMTDLLIALGLMSDARAPTGARSRPRSAD